MLRVGLWVFRPEPLQALGKLPRLQFLKLYPGSSATDPLEPVSLHENSFPALKRLCLKDLCWSHIETVLKHRPLVKNIVSLELTANDDETDSWENPQNTFLIPAGMTSLTDLAIEFDGNDYYEIYPGDAILDVLPQLPLRTVQITQAVFCDISELDFRRIFPSLTELRIPNHSADLYDFSRFAMIPNLKFFAVAPADLTITNQTTSGEVPVCPPLNTLKFTSFWSFEFPVQQVHIIAKHFLKLFPKLEKITWPEDDEMDNQHLILLSAHIEMLRERNDARARIAEQYGWDAANCLLPEDKRLHKSLP